MLGLGASPGSWDLRKAQPYECDSELDFGIPIAKHGDCYDRYLVRMEEMRQAVRIMKQCLDKLRSPVGQVPVIIEDHPVAPPRRASDEEFYGSNDRAFQALYRGMPRAKG